MRVKAEYKLKISLILRDLCMAVTREERMRGSCGGRHVLVVGRSLLFLGLDIFTIPTQLLHNFKAYWGGAHIIGSTPLCLGVVQ
jgi:hypothetical protein